MKSLGYLSAFLGGAIAGAALGILMAPEMMLWRIS